MSFTSRARLALVVALALTTFACSGTSEDTRAAGGSGVDVSSDGLSLGGDDTGTNLGTAQAAAVAVATPWPDRGPVGGGAIVILTGAGFGPEAVTLFGGNEAEVLHRDGSERLIVRTPAGQIGPVDVEVRNADGGKAVGGQLEKMIPASGPATGGTVALFSGSDLAAGAVFLLGWQVLTESAIIDAKTAQLTTPALGLGPHPLAIIHKDGQSALLENAFTAVDPSDLGPKPSIGALLPAASDVGGGAVVELSGTGFAEGSVLTIGGTAIAD